MTTSSTESDEVIRSAAERRGWRDLWCSASAPGSLYLELEKFEQRDPDIDGPDRLMFRVQVAPGHEAEVAHLFRDDIPEVGWACNGFTGAARRVGEDEYPGLAADYFLEATACLRVENQLPRPKKAQVSPRTARRALQMRKELFMAEDLRVPKQGLRVRGLGEGGPAWRR